MLRAHEIKLHYGEGTEKLPELVRRRFRLREGEPARWSIVRESLDARDRELLLVYTVDFSLEGPEALKREQALLRDFRGKGLEQAEERAYRPEGGPPPPGALRPVVAGFGPCGIFAALTLARLGWRPLVLERGKAMEERVRDVEAFWRDGVLEEESNVQFGEGGAGTFSDGKLTTRIKDRRVFWVLEALAAAGAPPEILYKQKPHIGTDVLREVVVRLREQTEALGGQVRFSCKVTGLETEEGRLRAVLVNGGPGAGGERIEARALVLALGHSARDTLRVLRETGLPMEQKAFSMGVRIEHLQSMVTEVQYGGLSGEGPGPGPADYQLSCRTAEGRGVYTFCMCPGGQVVGAVSQAGRLATNGMSYSRRDGMNANSALLVDVRPEDMGSPDPLAGVAFQERWEERAYRAGGGGYRAPAQRLGSFMTERAEEGDSFPDSPLQPSYCPGVTWTALESCLPDFVARGIREGVPLLDKKLPGFGSPEAVLTAIESRSSSPVRLLRDKETLQSAVAGVYPGGEGAGYAGGIVSAAVDGVRIGEKIASAGAEA
ncbi:MAG: hypothetical protein Q4C22_04735 [Bacillota bacterium]|nr:hypothetical protein [Bacillota bacterium]